MLRVIIALFFAVSLTAGCAPLRTGEVARLSASGIEGATSRQAVIGETGRSRMIGQVLVLRKDGVVALTAEVGQTGAGSGGRLRITGAWQAGAGLPFRRVTRYERFCTGAGDCRGLRTGVFLFTRSSFERAAREGYPATLIGPDGVVEIVIPAGLFVEAREQARTAGLWPA